MSPRLPADWRPKLEWPKDTGERPDLAKLGPFRWSPYMAPDWQAPDALGKMHSLAEHKGRPQLLVFYLGSGCSHCIEQLNLLGPVAKDYLKIAVARKPQAADAAALDKRIEELRDAQARLDVAKDETVGDKHFVVMDYFATQGGKPQQRRLEELVFNKRAKEPMTKGEFTFTGSRLWQGKFIAQTEGSIIALVTDPDAVFNNPRPNRDAEDTWLVREAEVPPQDTVVEVSVTLVPAGKGK